MSVYNAVCLRVYVSVLLLNYSNIPLIKTISEHIFSVFRMLLIVSFPTANIKCKCELECNMYTGRYI